MNNPGIINLTDFVTESGLKFKCSYFPQGSSATARGPIADAKDYGGTGVEVARVDVKNEEEAYVKLKEELIKKYGNGSFI